MSAQPNLLARGHASRGGPGRLICDEKASSGLLKPTDLWALLTERIAHLRPLMCLFRYCPSWPIFACRMSADCTQRQIGGSGGTRGRVLSISVMTMLGLAALPSSAIGQQRSLRINLSERGHSPRGSTCSRMAARSNRTAPLQRTELYSTRRTASFSCFHVPDLPKIMSNAPATATPEEAKALVGGSIASFG